MCVHRDFKGFIRKVVHEDLRPPMNPEWPSSLRILLAQCWHRNPGARPTMLHVNDTLRQCRKEVVVSFTLRTCDMSAFHEHVCMSACRIVTELSFSIFRQKMSVSAELGGF